MVSHACFNILTITVNNNANNGKNNSFTWLAHVLEVVSVICNGTSDAPQELYHFN